MDNPEFFCADCLRYVTKTDTEPGIPRPCPHCDSIRTVLYSMVDQIVDPRDKVKVLEDIRKANEL